MRIWGAAANLCGLGGVEAGDVFGRGAQAQDLELFELVFEDVHQPVVALGVDGEHVEPGVDDVVAVVADEAFDDFSVMKGGAYPEALGRREMVVEAEVV